MDYTSIDSLSAIHDTISFPRIIKSNWEIEMNSEDTIVGANYFVIYDNTGNIKVSLYYDGNI